ncbi:hypothetical protein [Fodinibius saliphilus]|uniref:hypothetical protein n=1 Tax=Fodinibius saliphilus TaxID=1920650 RepID=UPI0011086F09|nr:hypothetical protein [Fodinibius saliphilus]
MRISSARSVGLILGILIIFGGCDSAPVDKRYLNSKEFKQFSKTQKQEYAAQVSDRHSLEKFINALVVCKKKTKLSFPLQFKKNLLKSDGSKCSRVTKHFNTSFDVEIIGYSYFEPIFIRWIILERASVYENLELLVVTHKEDKVLDFQVVGNFRKNLSQKISTDIRVSQKGDFVYITSVSDRNLKYPIEQEQIVENKYLIGRKGQIGIQ